VIESNLQSSGNKNEINLWVLICLKNIIVNYYNVGFYSNLIFILIYIRNKPGSTKIYHITINNNQIKQYLKIIINIQRSYQNIYFIFYRYFYGRNFVFSPIDKDLSRTKSSGLVNAILF